MSISAVATWFMAVAHLAPYRRTRICQQLATCSMDSGNGNGNGNLRVAAGGRFGFLVLAIALALALALAGNEKLANMPRSALRSRHAYVAHNWRLCHKRRNATCNLQLMLLMRCWYARLLHFLLIFVAFPLDFLLVFLFGFLAVCLAFHSGCVACSRMRPLLAHSLNPWHWQQCIVFVAAETWLNLINICFLKTCPGYVKFSH